MRETGGFELASTITLVLQANRLTKCASPISHFFTAIGFKALKKFIEFLSGFYRVCDVCLELISKQFFMFIFQEFLLF